MNKSLCVYRDFSGIGDWLMCASVIKHINQQRPDIDVYVNLMAKNRFNNFPNLVFIPFLAREFLFHSNIKIKGFLYYSCPEKQTHFNYLSGNVVYNRGQKKHFIEGMVDCLNNNAGFNIQYKEGLYAQYSGNFEIIRDRQQYVLIQSCTKLKEKEKRGKSIGFNAMQKIVDYLVENQIQVIQIGAKEDYKLSNVIEYQFDLSLSELHSLMINSLSFIGFDGALSTYAGHHNFLHHTIYCNDFDFRWTHYSSRVQIDGNKNDPSKIAEFIVYDIARKRKEQLV